MTPQPILVLASCTTIVWPKTGCMSSTSIEKLSMYCSMCATPDASDVYVTGVHGSEAPPAPQQWRRWGVSFRAVCVRVRVRVRASV